MTKRTWFSVGLIFTPIVVFYALLIRETVNIPFLDDYYAVLGFATNWSRLHTAHEKALDLLTSQHNEYKLIFENVLLAGGYQLFHHINFAILSTIGNLLVLPLFLVIYLIWRKDSGAVKEPLILFIPVAWLLFQFQYYSLLDWAMVALQNIAVILFSLLAIYLLSLDERPAFYFSLASLVLAICSSGNGFFLVPIGILMLIQFRRPVRLASWLLVSALMLAIYLYRYNFQSSQAHAGGSVASSILHISPLYSLAFLGASIARYGSYMPAVTLGVCLAVVFVYMIVDKAYSDRPALFYSVCFIMITSIAVSGLRSDFGIAQSLVSRYRIYSNLLLALIYLYGMAKLQPRLQSRRSQLATAATVAFVAIGFNLGSTHAGFKLLRMRTELTKEGMRRWEHGEQSITDAPGPANEDPVIRRQRLNGNYAPVDQELRDAISSGVYSPPAL